MKTTDRLILIGIVASVLATIWSLIMIGIETISASDQRLFAAADRQHAQLIARACSPHGELWQNPLTGGHACIYSNRTGESMVRPIPDAPYLDGWTPPPGSKPAGWP